MNAWKKWAVKFCVSAVAVLATVMLALTWWLPTEEELALRLTALVDERFGVAVNIRSVGWSLLPTPSVTVYDFRTQQAQPVSIAKLKAYPNVRMLLQRKLVLEAVEIDGAVVPRNALRALRVKPQAMEATAGDGTQQIERFEFRNLTWISYSNVAVVFDGEIDFDSQWRPRRAELRRPGNTPPFTLSLTREADTDAWKAQIVVGGGTANGRVTLKTANDGSMQLSGQLAPRGIEVASAMSTFNRRSPVAGRATGETVLSASGKSVGALTGSLHTQTRFNVNAATVLRFDLDKAISTRGKQHDGQTDLQELTGQLDTQNGAEGMRVTLSDIRARAGSFTATGKATVYHGQIEASGNLDLVEGAVGVPFTLSGPAQKPKVSVPPGFYAGAAIGTVLLPGIGTAIGARIGGAIGKIFKGDAQKSKATK